jgi:transposase
MVPVLVLDIARYHNAVLLKPLQPKYRTARTLLFLPLNSPRLASVERGWKLARRMAMRNRFFAALDGVLRALEKTQLGTAEIMRHKSRRYL